MLDVIWGFAFVKSKNVGCGRVYGGFLLGPKICIQKMLQHNILKFFLLHFSNNR